MQLRFRNRSFLIFLAVPLLLMVISLPFVPAGPERDQTNSENTEGPEGLSDLSEKKVTTSGEAMNLDNVSLSDILQPVESFGPINSLLIHQNGHLIAEHYFRGMHETRTNNIKSVSKSILSLLVGIAIKEGYIMSVDQEISEFFPEYFSMNPNPVKESITIKDLLTMRAGLQSTSGRHYGRWVTSNNWVRYVLDRPLAGVPGEQRIYSTGTTHLLSVILARATGMNTRSFANQYLFAPMDIHLGGWDRDPQGYYLGGNNMALKPSDMIKIGRMMMNVGEYNGRQIVPREWVLESIEPVTGRRETVDDYGYLWFRRMSGGYHVIYAWGNGGQYIKIIPEIETVIAITSLNSSSGNTRNYRRHLIDALDTEIVPYLSVLYERDYL